MRARRMIWIELGTNFTRNYTVLRLGGDSKPVPAGNPGSAWVI